LILQRINSGQHIINIARLQLLLYIIICKDTQNLLNILSFFNITLSTLWLLLHDMQHLVGQIHYLCNQYLFIILKSNLLVILQDIILFLVIYQLQIKQFSASFLQQSIVILVLCLTKLIQFLELISSHKVINSANIQGIFPLKNQLLIKCTKSNCKHLSSSQHKPKLQNWEILELLALISSSVHIIKNLNLIPLIL